MQFILLLALSPGITRAEVFNVPCSPSDLNTTFGNASINGEADIVNLAENCTYTYTTSFDGEAATAIFGPLVVNGNGATIERDPSAPQFRIFNIGGDGTVTLNDLTIQNGHAPDGTGTAGASGETGGAIRMFESLELNRTVVRNNRSGSGASNINGGGGFGGVGGAIEVCEGCSLFITDSTFQNNQTGASGSGSEGAGPGFPGLGGAIYISSATSGPTSLLTVSRSLFENNSVGEIGFGDGSGIFPRGGAIYSLDAILDITNTTFSGNSAADGAAITSFADDAGSLSLQFVSVVDNVGDNAIEYGSDTQAPLIAHSIFRNGASVDCRIIDSASFNALSVYNLFEDSTSDDACDMSNTNNNVLNANLPLSPLAKNGGRTKTHALLDGNDAIDRGPINFTAVTTDQRGVRRPQFSFLSINDRPDSGAFETTPGFFRLNNNVELPNEEIETPTQDNYIAIYLDAGESVEARIEFTHAFGDLDMHLYRRDNLSSFIDSSAGIFDSETIEFTADESGEYWIRVFGFAGATNNYSMTISFDRVLTCFVVQTAANARVPICF
ncbi:MAG: PPC domain-containing protein [Pseudomonadota bacterium]